MKKAKVIISDRIRIPKKLISKRKIKKRYDIEIFQESKCQVCDNLGDRSPLNEICKGCKAFGGAFLTIR